MPHPQVLTYDTYEFIFLQLYFQLQEALAILENYPGVERIVDCDKARDFLESLKSVADKIGIPHFGGLGNEEKPKQS